MTTRFKKSGELLLCYGRPEVPAAEELENRGHRKLELLVALLVFVMGMLFFAPNALG
jgi:hypothetical protein